MIKDIVKTLAIAVSH